MIKTETLDSASKIFETVESSIHQDHSTTLPEFSSPKITKLDNTTDINSVIENLKRPEYAAQSLSYLCEFHDLNILLNQKTELIPHIISFISMSTPNLIIPSLQFLERCCSFENFPILLLNFIPFQNLAELAFSINNKKAIMCISRIMSKIIFSIGKSGEQIILLFLARTDQIENDFLKAASINILSAYLQNSKSYTTFFQQINLIDRLNANLLMLNYRKQLIYSLKAIEICIKEINVAYTSFNIPQIIKLIKSNVLSIQELSIGIVTTILLFSPYNDFHFINELCKSLRWVFLNGALNLKLKALYCLKTFIGLYSDQSPQIMELIDDHLFESILGLLSSGTNGSVEAISFLIYLVQDDLHPEIKFQTIKSLMDFDIHEQLELLASEEGMIATHTSVLLNMIEKSYDINPEVLV